MTPIYSSHIIHWINIILPRTCIPGLVSIICEFVSFDFDTNIFLSLSIFLTSIVSLVMTGVFFLSSFLGANYQLFIFVYHISLKSSLKSCASCHQQLFAYLSRLTS